MNSIKQFFNLVKYEMLRVTRNKFVFFMFLFFPIIFFMGFLFLQSNNQNYPVAIYSDGLNLEEVKVVEFMKETLSLNKSIIVENKEEGLNLVNSGQVCFFLCLKKGENKDETTATFYYDESSLAGSNVAAMISINKNAFTYDAIKNFLEKNGIILNETYFNLINIESSGTKQINLAQKTYSIGFASCFSIILMLGLAYSLARDNETKISKNIAYIPIGVNKYLLSKVFPYIILGIIEIIIGLIIGVLFFHLDFKTNFFIVFLLLLFAILPIVMLGLLFSLFKSQIATIFLDLLVILIPIFLFSTVFLPACPWFVQFIMYCVPITPFVNLLNTMIFNGIIVWWYLPIFILQALLFYIIAYIVVKKRLSE